MRVPEIVIVATLAENNRVIGYHSQIPWVLPENIHRLQTLTAGHTVIIGRRTWAETMKQCPPSDHRYIVITAQPSRYQPVTLSSSYFPGIRFVPSLRAAIQAAEQDDQVFVMGGSSIYSQALPIADRLDLTLVAGDYEGDTFFPDYTALVDSQFERSLVEQYQGFRVETYRRLSLLTGLPVLYTDPIQSLVSANQACPYLPLKRKNALDGVAKVSRG